MYHVGIVPVGSTHLKSPYHMFRKRFLQISIWGFSQPIQRADGLEVQIYGQENKEEACLVGPLMIGRPGEKSS